ncbi:Protein of unknown function [Marinitoga hydrogenitolerans DSM 16785]|uniref:DUF935 family protein n=1 Tax=Marinitoga hydrogenitolerans (strain DSM 16785 / JCM 12826 / AT1271) TaxID=1122195 RepID=A0A1M4TU27_MARH1|nr:DUF935 family protein [Marinitoga hydrogenitolerans]SHE47807.1 Protein of unknown function [Marinitoga hydrogenitolerans DSM 16785]
MEVKKEELTKQIATTWAALRQDVSEIMNIPDLDNDTIKNMLRDETISSALNFLTKNIINFIGEYVHEDEEKNAFVNTNFENLDISLEVISERILTDAIAYGFSVSELVWELKNNKLYLKKIIPLDPSTISFYLSDGEIIKIIQKTSNKNIEIPVEKCFIFRLNQRELYGKTELEKIYRAWKFKSIMFKFWAIAMERYAMPIAHGKTLGDTEELLNALKSIWSQGVIATDPETEIELLEPKSTIADSFEKSIEYTNMLIYRGLLLPQLLAGTQNVGSYSLGKVHMDLFLSSVRKMAKYYSENLIDSVVAKMIEYNFADVKSYGRFLEAEQPSNDERTKLAQVVNTLINTGIVDPIEDNDWIRDLFKFPKNAEISKVDEADDWN